MARPSRLVNLRAIPAAPANQSVTPGVVVLTATTIAPALARTVQPNVTTLAATTIPPAVSVTGASQTATPTVVVLSATLQAPAAVATVQASPSVVVVTASTVPPTVSVVGPQSVTPGVVLLSLTLLTPAVSNAVVVSPGGGRVGMRPHQVPVARALHPRLLRLSATVLGSRTRPGPVYARPDVLTLATQAQAPASVLIGWSLAQRLDQEEFFGIV